MISEHVVAHVDRGSKVYTLLSFRFMADSDSNSFFPSSRIHFVKLDVYKFYAIKRFFNVFVRHFVSEIADRRHLGGVNLGTLL